MSSIETGAIQRFMDLVKRGSQARARDVRIEITDATILAAEIAIVLSRLTTLTNAALGEATRSGNTAMDGGTLR